jgi:conjugal transfer pilus assembly protein TraE
MIFSRYMSDRGTAFKMVDVLGTSVLILIIIVCILLNSALTNHERIILLPLKLDKRTELAYDSASKEYHEKYGLSLAALLGNMTPSTSHTTVSALKSILTASLYRDLKEVLEKQADEIKNSGVSLSFSPDKWEFEPLTDSTYVTGTQTITPLNGDTREKVVTFEFKLIVNQYVPFISYFDFYDGPAHNSFWRSKNTRIVTPSNAGVSK